MQQRWHLLKSSARNAYWGFVYAPIRHGSWEAGDVWRGIAWSDLKNALR